MNTVSTSIVVLNIIADDKVRQSVNPPKVTKKEPSGLVTDENIGSFWLSCRQRVEHCIGLRNQLDNV